jgi:hypothetical protein
VPVELSVQAPLPEKLPLPELEKLTVPVGVDFVPPAVSVTVAVQVVGAFSATDEGEQPTLVVFARLVVVSVSEPLLVACLALPP